jgi:hypothetical protein
LCQKEQKQSGCDTLRQIEAEASNQTKRAGHHELERRSQSKWLN